MDFSFLDIWHEFLPREGGHVVAFMGAGGKSTLLQACAAVYAAEGRPCFTAATVPGGPPGRGPRFEAWELREGGIGLAAGVTLVRVGDEQAPADPADIDALGELLVDHIGLVEVDAADGLPLKMPGPTAPLWPASTSLAVVVMGTRAVGSPAADVVAGFAPEGLPDAGLAPWSTWEWDHSLQLLVGPGGYLEQVPPDVPVVLALTGLDEQPDSIGLFDFTGRAMADERLPIVLLCGFEEGQPAIRAAYRIDDPESDPEPEHDSGG